MCLLLCVLLCDSSSSTIDQLLQEPKDAEEGRDEKTWRIREKERENNLPCPRERKRKQLPHRVAMEVLYTKITALIPWRQVCRRLLLLPTSRASLLSSVTAVQSSTYLTQQRKYEDDDDNEVERDESIDSPFPAFLSFSLSVILFFLTMNQLSFCLQVKWIALALATGDTIKNGNPLPRAKDQALCLIVRKLNAVPEGVLLVLSLLFLLFCVLPLGFYSCVCVSVLLLQCRTFAASTVNFTFILRVKVSCCWCVCLFS